MSASKIKWKRVGDGGGEGGGGVEEDEHHDYPPSHDDHQRCGWHDFVS